MTALRIAVAASLAVLLLTPRDAQAYTHTFCLEHGVAPVDAGVGEDYVTSSPDTIKAYGIRYLVASTGGTVAGYAGQNTGCFTFTSSVSGPFSMTVYAEAKLDYGEEILIRAWRWLEEYEDWLNDPVPGNLKSWLYTNVWPDSCGGSGGQVCQLDLTLTPNNLPVRNMLAYAVRQVRRLERKTDGLSTTQPPVLELINEECGVATPPEGSCQGGDIVKIQQNGDRRKFLVSHEVGHWYHYMWLDRAPLSFNMSDPFGLQFPVPGFEPYECDSALDFEYQHLMRSVEHQGGAFVEGFAHFLATVTYNDFENEHDAWFKYYKAWDGLPGRSLGSWAYDYDTIEANGDILFPPVGGGMDWLHNTCDCSTNPGPMDPCNDWGVELDWLRHYWTFLNAGIDDPPPTLTNILDHTRTTFEDSPLGFGELDAHDNLEANLSAFQGTWDLIADLTGVDPSPE